MDPVDVRDRLVDVLREDLIGPTEPEEALQESPSRWYLTGFLVPFEGGEAARSDPEADDELEAPGDSGDEEDATQPEEVSKRKVLLPASIGISVLLPPGTRTIDVTAHWGDYVRDDTPAGEEPKRDRPWRRKPRTAIRTVTIEPNEREPTIIALEERKGLELQVLSRTVGDGGGTATSVFLVNRRLPVIPRDSSTAFQVRLSMSCDPGFVGRPNLRGRDDGHSAPADFDEQMADLQYRDAFEYAVGHGVATEAKLDGDGACRHVETVWIPSAEVEKVVPAAAGVAEMGMGALAEAPDLPAALLPLADAYRRWIEDQAKTPLAEEAHRSVLAELMGNARYVQGRIREGIEALADPDAALAFRIANRAMARVARVSRPNDAPAWYPFQLAFVLMNVPGIVNPEHASRRDVDLLFFPTGGGKTEAYLGLAAFTLVYRRLRHRDIRGAGVSVLMRYTLRLLTLDQLRRAAALVCALELERDGEPRLGTWPFEIGLWVGRAATPNRMGKKGDNDPHSAREKTLAYRNRSKGNPVPIPLEKCPWCGEPFKAKSFRLTPNDEAPTQLEVLCVNPRCVWSGDRPLPIVAVDVPLYRRLPCFVLATVDKFAQLPWVGETGALFGRVARHDAAGFYGPCDDPRIGAPIPGGRLPPPDLIIQDELHLIAGPLGTLVGLYETAIDTLATDVTGARPKVVASTATARRASQQIRALFARPETVVFPPPGPNRRDSFFARTVPVPPSREQRTAPGFANARRYVGIAAPGRSLKKTMLRTYLSLLSAAQRLYEQQGGHEVKDNPAAPYMTLVGYFNSLRELGGSRRIVEDEVTTRLYAYDRRRPAVFAKRSLGEVVELTSREPTFRVAESQERLRALPREKEKRPVDVVLATNMISVGLDIPRLGLMAVLGQPKTTAEYIQATSRVGRVAQLPGLVVTLFNVHRPRDRSHYERFQAYHESFYRAVEAVSVTPFSPRAIDRAAPAVTVTLARLSEAGLTPIKGAAKINEARPVVERVKDAFQARAKGALGDEAPSLPVDVGKRVGDLFDSWQRVAERHRKSHSVLGYTSAEKGQQALLYDPLEAPPEDKDAAKFKAQRSLRDVEPSVNLFVRIPETEGE
ncbi:DISARM system helicase DrmA [Sorangium sp. So ce513]|uniref:DISARM system helicase DrmA n=1 Tax=Sorangium sp. So ce513 TaxID=3133315 RepID=UPI003F601B22